jgi:hypothetical protein
MKTLTRLLLTLFVLPAGVGCVHVHQLVKMNHDGSGEMEERITVLPRAIRLLEGRKHRTGQSESEFDLLSDGTLEQRLKNAGELTVKSKNRMTLPDGSQRLEVIYSFKDINKVRFWVAPTFACTQKDRNGAMGFRYERIIADHGQPPRFFTADRLSVACGRPPNQSQFSSPSVIQQYKQINPIFLDMLHDFKFTIEVQAPADVENFEDDTGAVNGMVVNQKNRVVPYRAYGENVTQNPEIIRAFITGEVGGRIDAWGGQWRTLEQSVSNTYTPYGCHYGGMSVRFMKLSEVKKIDQGGK